MVRFAILLMLASVSAGWAGPFDDPLSASAIREVLARQLRGDPNIVAMEFDDEGGLRIDTRSGEPRIIHFDNLMRTMEIAEPSERRRELERFVVVIRGRLGSGPVQLSYDSLFLNVYSAEYMRFSLGDALDGGPNGAGRDAGEPRTRIAPDLWAALTLDTPESAALIGAADQLTAAGLDVEVALMRSRENTAALAEKLTYSQVGQIWALYLDGYYEPAMMLVTEIWPIFGEIIDGTPVVAVPARGHLMVARAEDAAGLRELRRRAAETFESAPHSITDTLYRWNGGGWDPL